MMMLVVAVGTVALQTFSGEAVDCFNSPAPLNTGITLLIEMSN